MTPTDAITEAAIGWLVTLNSGAVSPEERRGFDAWLAASDHHRRVWQQLTGALEQTFAPAAGHGAALGRTLARAEGHTRARRRWLRGALAVGGVAGGVALVRAERSAPLAQWGAGLRTGTAERRAIVLPDGSDLTLDARSAVDLDFDDGSRRVSLRAGAIVIHDSNPAGGSLRIRTPHGEVEAAGHGGVAGARFMVRDEGAVSYVGVLAQEVDLLADAGRRRLSAGQAARFGPEGIDSDTVPAPRAASAWTQGRLEVHDEPLGDVIEALRAYRRGLVRITARAAALRLYGSYALDDSDQVLALLASTLPIQVRTYRGGWLVTIDALPDPRAGRQGGGEET